MWQFSPRNSPKSQKKAQLALGFSASERIRLTCAAGADHFDFHATVRLLAGDLSGAVALARLRINLQLALALAFGVHAVGFDALAHQVSLDRFSTTDRQAIVVLVRTERVGVANGD